MGKGAVFGEGDRGVDGGLHPFVDDLQLVLCHGVARQHVFPKEFDGVERGSILLVFLGHLVGLRVALEMPVEAVRLAFQQGRPLPGPGARNGLARGLVHREDVVPVHGHARHVVGRGAVRDVLHAAMIGGRRGLGVAVVLGDEHHGQVPDRGQIQAFVQGALFGRAVAEETDRDLIGLPGLGRQPGPARQRRPAAHDAVRPQHPLVHVGDVHGAALTLTDAGRLAVQLGHHALHVHTLGDAVAVAAVRGGHEVRVGQIRADADRHGLFPGVQMHEAGNLPLAELDLDAVLELPDGLHPFVHPQQGVLGQFHAALLLN